MVVMVSKVTLNMELVNTESFFLEEIQGQVLASLWSQYFLSTDQYIILLYVCFSVAIPYLTHILIH